MIAIEKKNTQLFEQFNHAQPTSSYVTCFQCNSF